MRDNNTIYDLQKANVQIVYKESVINGFSYSSPAVVGCNRGLSDSLTT